MFLKCTLLVALNGCYYSLLLLFLIFARRELKRFIVIGKVNAHLYITLRIRPKAKYKARAEVLFLT